MKKILLVLLGVVCSVTFVNAQGNDVLNGVYVKEHVPARKPVPYHYLREADMAWTKTIWRMIDLKEKINHPLYYPITKQDDRYCLINLLLYGINNEGLTVYAAGNDDEFVTPLTLAQINDKLGVGVDTTYIDNMETGEQEQKIIPREMDASQILRVLLKEVWYFDKQRAMLECRIVGICPIRMYEKQAALNAEVTSDTSDEKDLSVVPVFWVYYPSIRPLLANHEVFNSNNDAERRTFDDIFFKRRFSSYIFRETNVYENRYIADFKFGLDALIESDRVKDFIFKFEHDLWEY
jgi:gliding motility associated protien GldN